MDIQIRSGDIAKIKSDILILPVFHNIESNDNIKKINKLLSNGLIDKASKNNFNGEIGRFILYDTAGKLNISSIMLLGLGTKRSLNKSYIYRLASIASKNLKKIGSNVVVDYNLPSKKGYLSSFLEGFIQGSYEFNKYKTKNNKNFAYKSLQIITKNKFPSLKKDIDYALELSAAVSLCRDLVNEPPVFLTPTKLAEISTEISEEGKLDIKVFDSEEMKKNGMEAILAVARGSKQPPKFIHMKYKPKNTNRKIKKVAVVGKGITFDSGGLCLKPADSMRTMKMDMGGAAVVVGVMKAISKLKPNLEVHGIIPTTENMTGGDAYKPDDVIYAMNGKSIEIINTDAEGRIALSDALSYSVKLKVDEIIDLATLTGACMVGLGSYTAGVMGNNQKLVNGILESANEVGEKMWQLPLDDELKQEIESTVADVKNVGSRWGGAITAGLFLENFVSNKSWVHIDIAGPTYMDKGNKWYPAGASGFGVRTVVKYLMDQ